MTNFTNTNLQILQINVTKMELNIGNSYFCLPHISMYIYRYIHETPYRCIFLCHILEKHKSARLKACETADSVVLASADTGLLTLTSWSIRTHDKQHDGCTERQ